MSKGYSLKKWYPSLPKEMNIGFEVFKNDNLCNYSNPQTRFYPLSLDEIENNPEFWELIKEKEWKIISIIPTKLSLVDKNHIIKNGITELQIELILNTKKWQINSIKRFFDNEVFTLGDKIQIKGSYQETKEILSFSEDEYGYYINGVALSRIEKVIPKALFITEDGIEVFKGDNVYYVLSNLVLKNYHPARDDRDLINTHYFSTQKAAMDYISLNRIRYSVNDIKSALIGICTHKTAECIIKELGRLNK